jgi:amidase
MTSSDEFMNLDATAQAELVRQKKVKPIELVEAAIARIERLNPKLNAVVTPLLESARAAAEKRLPDGPFKGVPFLIKDLVAEREGTRLAEGTAFSQEYVSVEDSELVRRQRRAGLIILGKTNTPELGILPTTEPRRFGPARNPWDLSRTTGGSSGGSGAAVGARLVAMAHGNDGGGSIRIPASCCGVFGLKPTRNRNSLAPNFGDHMSGLVVEHALTVSVRDSAALLDATAGPATGDPYYPPPPARPYLREVGAPPGKLRIGLMTAAVTGAAVHEECLRATADAAKLCSALGHRVEEAKLELDPGSVLGAFTTVWFASFAWEIEAMARKYGRAATAADFEPLTWAIREAGVKASAVDYILAVQQLQRVSREIMALWEQFDVVLTPTLAEPPLALGSFEAPEDPMLGFMRAASFAPFTATANITGQPAMSVPLSWTSAGLPIGSQFLGRYGDEATLFRLAGQLEEARPWAGRLPPVG